MYTIYYIHTKIDKLEYLLYFECMKITASLVEYRPTQKESVIKFFLELFPKLCLVAD